MLVHPKDRPIVKWAVDRSVPWYYTEDPELPEPCLKLHCGHVTAYFCQGRLMRVSAAAECNQIEDLLAEIGALLELAGVPKRGAPGLNRFTPAMMRPRWDMPGTFWS